MVVVLVLLRLGDFWLQHFNMRLLSSRLKNVVRILQFLREKLNLNCIFLSQEFFVALRLVACAQNGLEVSLSSLNLAVPPPRFVRNAFKFKLYFKN